MNKKTIVEDARMTIRAAVGDVSNAVSVDDAIKVLKGELDELERYRSQGRQPSDEFLSAICHSGTLVVDCEHCGVTHFATYDENDYDDGELDELRERSRMEPDKYIEDGVSLRSPTATSMESNSCGDVPVMVRKNLKYGYGRTATSSLPTLPRERTDRSETLTETTKSRGISPKL